jgi:hypothetical protein
MGTSISQGSPRSGPNWKPVLKCYEDSRIPENRIINEIWRASENEHIPISTQLKSEAIFNCFKAVKDSSNVADALNTFTQAVIDSKNNSIIAEFAKRAIPISFQNKYPADTWPNRFFTEITNYLVSRDSSGFVGANYRNKSVNEMIDFKKTISSKVGQLINSEKKNIVSQASWNSFVDRVIKKLKTE